MTQSDPRDDYLFDRSGPADPDVARLERALRPLGTTDDAAFRVPPRPARRGRLVPALGGLAAAAALVAAVTLLGPRPGTGPAGRDAGGDVAAGTWIETRDAPQELRLGDVSRVVVAPRTRLHVRRADDDLQHLYLARGTIEAFVSADARPRFFQVATDAANCVDLGCSYTLEVADDGTATVRVATGQVAFETPSREVFVPAGAEAVARRGAGPGTPRFTDAPQALRDAFDEFDRSGGEARADAARAALATVTRPRDTLSAWHLLQEEDADVVRAAVARLEAVAGACDVPSDGTPADVRAAWKAFLFGQCW